MTPEDRLALTDLVHRYAAWIDDRRFGDVVRLFAADATLSTPEPPQSLEPTTVHRGHDEIGRAVASVTTTARTQHAIVGEVYDSASQELASGRIACIAHHWIDAGDELRDVAWHLRYDDEYVRTAPGWRFRSRVITIDAIETRPVRRLRPDGL